MTYGSLKRKAQVFMADIEAENQRLRFRVEQLEEKVRFERRRADKHAEELAYARQELADYQQRMAQRFNGVGR